MVQVYSFLALQLFPSSVVAQQRAVPRSAEATPFIAGQQFAKRAPAPVPTSPPQVVRNALLGRDAATCGWMISDGSPNVCAEAQYCTTTASNSEFGVWNCCNTDSCYLATGCTKDVECTGDANYCVTSYMSNAGTTYSRFMCGTSSSIISMAYLREDTPQFTASELSVSASSAALASAVSASLASVLESQSATSTSVDTSQSEATSQSATTTTEKKSGLSTGAIVGIVIGALVGLIALIGVIGLVIWRRRKNAAKKHPSAYTATEMSGGPAGYYKPHIYPDTYAHQGHAGTPQYPVELDGPDVQELGTEQ